MDKSYLAIEFFILMFLYFKYFGNVIYISYDNLSPDKLDYENIIFELQERLPNYTVKSGLFRAPDFIHFLGIIALQFLSGGIYNLIWPIYKLRISNKIKLMAFFIIFFGILASVIEKERAFGISYEGHDIYASLDTEMPQVDQLVEIIKENASPLTFPKGVLITGVLYFCTDTFMPSGGRRRYHNVKWNNRNK